MLRKTARRAEYNEVTSTTRYGQPGKPQCTCLPYKVRPKSVKIVLHTSKIHVPRNILSKRNYDTAPTLFTNWLLRSYCHIFSFSLQRIQQCTKNTHYSEWLVKVKQLVQELNPSGMRQCPSTSANRRFERTSCRTNWPWKVIAHTFLWQVGKQPTRVSHPRSPESSSSPLRPP